MSMGRRPPRRPCGARRWPRSAAGSRPRCRRRDRVADTASKTDPLTPVLTKRWLSPKSWRLATYEQLEGYTAIRKALRMTPEEIVELVKEAGRRGRGGAGLPAGGGGSFMPARRAQ